MIANPAQLPDDVDALKRMIVAMAQDAVHARTLIEKLRFELARLKRQQFGTSSDKLDGRVEQLELAIEAIETDRAERSRATEASVSEPLEMQGRSRPGGLCPTISRARRSSTLVAAPVRPAAASCDASVRT